MDFDLRTCTAANNFVLEFMGMTNDEFVMEFEKNCNKDFGIFWKRNIERIKAVDVSRIRMIAFHILGALDECNEIKENGLRNLQEVLSSNTILRRNLENEGITFDIPNKKINCNYCQNSIFINQNGVERRLYKDYCVNGFFYNSDAYNYGDKVRERPEFLKTLSELCPIGKKVERFWRENSTSYIIIFFVTVDQIDPLSTFSINEKEDGSNQNIEMAIKKWMLSHAVERQRESSEIICYLKDEATVPPNQILEIVKL